MRAMLSPWWGLVKKVMYELAKSMMFTASPFPGLKPRAQPYPGIEMPGSTYKAPPGLERTVCPPVPLHPVPLSRCPALDVEGVAEAVAEEVGGEDGEADRGAGGEPEPGLGGEGGGVAGLVEDGPPAGGGLGDAESEERQTGFGEDGAGDAEGTGDGERADDVGGDVAVHDV